MFPKLKIYKEISIKKCRSQGQNPKTKTKARTFKTMAEAKAWTVEAKAKALNP